jgi:hypothetical protein
VIRGRAPLESPTQKIARVYISKVRVVSQPIARTRAPPGTRRARPCGPLGFPAYRASVSAGVATSDLRSVLSEHTADRPHPFTDDQAVLPRASRGGSASGELGTFRAYLCAFTASTGSG